MQSIVNRVARGSQWLDAHYPGWWTKINLLDLAVSNCQRCILGQVYTRVIPTFEQNQILAQVLAQGAQVVRVGGAPSGYNVLYFHHDLDYTAGQLGFAAIGLPLYDRNGHDISTAEEFEMLTDEWTRVIIERRIDNHPDLADLAVCRRGPVMV